MPRLSLKQYAALLYETVGEYDFPPVTYNFAKDPCYTLKKAGANPHKQDKLPVMTACVLSRIYRRFIAQPRGIRGPGRPFECPVLGACPGGL